MDWLTQLFDSSEFRTRWESRGWSAGLARLHNAADAIILVACIAIPATLIGFARRRRDLPFPWVFWLFGGCIFACGATHLMEVIVSFVPMYRLSGVVKLFAALVWQLAPARPGRRGATSSPVIALFRQHWRLLVVLVSVVAVRSWASTSLTTFLPVLATRHGAEPAQAAEVLTVFLISGGIGGLVGGVAADRLGRDRVVVGSLLLSVPFGVYLGVVGWFDLTVWIAAAAVGFFLNGSWVSLTVRAQESIPGSIAMMSGLMLGLSIGLGGLAVTPIGLLAERLSLGTVLTGVACLPVLAALMMRFLPRASRG